MTWPDVLDRTAAGQPTGLNLQRVRFRLRRVPLTIVGNAGAGKSRIWSLLTKQPYLERASVTKDEAYMLRRNNDAIALTTIPGQTSNSRYATLQHYFRESRPLEGVIFVACNGFDYIWPERRVTVLPSIKPYRLEALRKRNKRKELDRFTQLCEMLAERLISDRPNPPKWLMVVVNKLDLFWDELDQAEKYYLPGSDSVFASVAQDLFSDIGRARPFGYDVLPLASVASDYSFHSARGTLTKSSKLTPIQCEASVGCLVEALEERCGR
jgi:hypothetical protein